MIKVSDFIIKFIESLGVKHAFLISGAGNIYLIDSISRSNKIQYICNHHEQACAIAAESYSRVTGNIGVCLVTTGPGGTNAITGVYGAWTDSIPMLVISGQIRRETIGAGKKLRQLGDQEVNIIDIVKPITKYAVLIKDPLDIQYHLQKAVYLAKSGRPGPVWLDIPLDIQGSYIQENKQKKFNPKELPLQYETEKEKLRKLLNKTIEKLQKAKRPVLIVGNGVRLSNASKELLDLIKLLKIPVITSFAGYDLVSNENPYYYGRMGILGQRAANFIVQNTDFLFSLGSRLPIRTIGYNTKSFARNAYKAVVDIDKEELKKNTLKIDMAINYDVKDVIKESIKLLNRKNLGLKIQDWIEYCKAINNKYPAVLPKYRAEKSHVNSYYFIEMFSKYLKSKDILAVSDGTALVCTYQALKLKQGLRVILNSGCAAMGYGLPAAVGACFANNKKSVICLEGDGSIQLNIQELQTIVHHKLPIKIFVYNNNGYVSIRLTQKGLFNSNFVASDPTSGLSCPDIIRIAKAYGIRTERIVNNAAVKAKVKRVLEYKGPIVCEVMLSPEHEFLPKSSAQKLPDGSLVSKPLEDMYPFLTKEELKENMIIPLWIK